MASRALVTMVIALLAVGCGRAELPGLDAPGQPAGSPRLDGRRVADSRPVEWDGGTAAPGDGDAGVSARDAGGPSDDDAGGPSNDAGT